MSVFYQNSKIKFVSFFKISLFLVFFRFDFLTCIHFVWNVTVVSVVRELFIHVGQVDERRSGTVLPGLRTLVSADHVILQILQWQWNWANRLHQRTNVAVIATLALQTRVVLIPTSFPAHHPSKLLAAFDVPVHSANLFAGLFLGAKIRQHPFDSLVQGVEVVWNLKQIYRDALPAVVLFTFFLIASFVFLTGVKVVARCGLQKEGSDVSPDVCLSIPKLVNLVVSLWGRHFW